MSLSSAMAVIRQYHASGLPSIPRMAANLAGAAVDLAVDTIHTVSTEGIENVSEVLAGTEERAERLAICESCEFRVGDRCSVCGCFLKPKVSVRAWHCPKGKW